MDGLKRSILLCVIIIGLTGCASKVTTTVVEEAGKITKTFSGAAIQRDIVYADKRKHRDTQVEKMYAKSGVVMEYELVKFSDQYSAWLPKEITVRAPNTWMQKIADTPPDHRGWNTLDKGLNILGKGILGYFLNEAFQTNSNAGQTKYYGDYNPQTAAPYIVEPL